MAIRKSSNSRLRLHSWLGYGLYTLVLLIGFLYVLFPYENLQEWLEHRVEQQLGIHIQAKERKAGPFWVEWNGLQLSGEQTSQFERLYFSVARITFHPQSVIDRPLQLSTTFSLEEARGEGWITLSPHSSDYEFRLVQSLSNLDVTLAQLPYIESGRVTVDVDYEWNQDSPVTGRGQGTFAFDSVQMKDLPLIAGATFPLTVSSARGVVSMKEKQFVLRNFQARGKGFSFTGQGRLQIYPNFIDSQLDGEGILYLSKEFVEQFQDLQYLRVAPGQPISIKFMGTVQAPSIEFNDIRIPLDSSLLFKAMS